LFQTPNIAILPWVYPVLGALSQQENIMDVSPRFQPTALYEFWRDALTYICADVSWRAEAVAPHLELLWLPYERGLIGCRIHGLGYLLDFIHPNDLRITPHGELPLRVLLEHARAQELRVQDRALYALPSERFQHALIPEHTWRVSHL
jgi:hypothetical protein